MGYQIDAWLEDGQPRLHIIDADSGHLRLAWKSETSAASSGSSELKSLFHDLLLLGAIENLALYPCGLCDKTKP